MEFIYEADTGRCWLFQAEVHGSTVFGGTKLVFKLQPGKGDIIYEPGQGVIVRRNGNSLVVTDVRMPYVQGNLNGKDISFIGDRLPNAVRQEKNTEITGLFSGEFSLDKIKILSMFPYYGGWQITYTHGLQTVKGNPDGLSIYPLEWEGKAAHMEIVEWNDDWLRGRIDGREFEIDLYHMSSNPNLSKREIRTLLEELGADDLLPPEED